MTINMRYRETKIMPSTLKTVPEIRIHPGNATSRLTGLISESPRMLSFLALFCVLTALGQVSFGREWSEQVRMTHAGPNYLSTRNMRVVKDSRDDIHVLYTYQSVEDENLAEAQPVYQKFNRYGEALTEPIMVGLIANMPDTIAGGMDLFCDRDDQITILWGNRAKWISRLGQDGEVIIANSLLEGFGTFFHESPRMVVDSEGNIILMALVLLPPDREEHYTTMTYGRFTPEGELIDSLHILWEEESEGGYARTFQMYIGSGDTLHIAFQVNYNEYTVHYFKISPDDEYVVDDFLIPRIDWGGGSMYVDFAVDALNRPVFIGLDGDENYLMRFNTVLEREFLTHIGRRGYGPGGEIVIDENGHIHIVDSFDEDELNDGVLCIGYAEYNENGEIIDSLQVIHDQSMRQGRRPANWAKIGIFASSDSGVGVVWADYRYIDYEADVAAELFMRYSVSPNSVKKEDPSLPGAMLLHPAYPNPFNSITTVRFSLPASERVRLSIFDLCGREVAVLANRQFAAGQHSAHWNATDFSSGVYFCRIRAGDFVGVKKVMLMR